ncbi:hypothetical protein Patl1_29001 [Pistacia atlantica]|uniref:Uncharacterized protein n=1 Tax=Pistacia atlantica TaxID=434234 RepID=A0ACC1BGW6_9ROSI|nr:hypothetical protein Patl1_29001 [Pistacia atlantica]
MEGNPDPEHRMMIEESYQQSMQIDPSRARFPCCIVWSPLPVISWLIPFIGHTGICREDGVILDFAGPNFVCVDSFSFGAATRYIQVNKEQCCISPYLSALNGDDQYQPNESGRDTLTWDDALRKSTEEFQHRSYDLFTCNCHSFVANNLNRLGFNSGGWNVVNLSCIYFPQGSLGELYIHITNFAAIYYSNLSWTHIWWLDLHQVLGILHPASCWLVSCWYLLFQ